MLFLMLLLPRNSQNEQSTFLLAFNWKSKSMVSIHEHVVPEEPSPDQFDQKPTRDEMVTHITFES